MSMGGNPSASRIGLIRASEAADDGGSDARTDELTSVSAWIRSITDIVDTFTTGGRTIVTQWGKWMSDERLEGTVKANILSTSCVAPPSTQHSAVTF